MLKDLLAESAKQFEELWKKETTSKTGYIPFGLFHPFRDHHLARISSAFALGEQSGIKKAVEEAINLIKAPRHCLVQSCVRCEEQERAINILSSLLSKNKVNKVCEPCLENWPENYPCDRHLQSNLTTHKD